MTDDIAKIADGLSEAQRKICLASEPGGYGMDNRSIGVELIGVGMISAARALERKGLGYVDEGGGGFAWLYFNKDWGDSEGLRLRNYLRSKDDA